MRKMLLGLVAAALPLTIAACGTDESENNVAAEDVNALTNLDEPAPAEPIGNAPAEAIASEEPQVNPTASKPAPAKPAPAPAKPKRPEPEPAPDPHAGHDMNNISN